MTSEYDIGLSKEFEVALSRSDARLIRETLKKALRSDTDAYG